MGRILSRIQSPSNDRDRSPTGDEWIRLAGLSVSVPSIVMFMAFFGILDAGGSFIKYTVMPWVMSVSLVAVDICIRHVLNRPYASAIWKRVWEHRAVLMLIVFFGLVFFSFWSLNALEARSML